jgi:hypothetical protein
MKYLLLIIAVISIVSVTIIDINDVKPLTSELTKNIYIREEYARFNKDYESRLVKTVINKQLDTTRTQLDPYGLLRDEKRYIKNLSYITNIDDNISLMSNNLQKYSNIILILVILSSISLLIFTVISLKESEVEETN